MLENARFAAARLRRVLTQLPYVARTLELVWSAARGWTLAWGGLLILQGLLPVVTVYLTRSLVNALVAAQAAGGSWQSVRPALMLVALMAGVLLITQVLGSVTTWIRNAQAELVKDRIS